MDLTTLAEVRIPRSRIDVVVGGSVAPLAGGTWLYSEPQDHLTGLVDLMALGWTPWEALTDGGLAVAATCTIAELVAIPARAEWRALPLFRQCAESLLQSFKVWHTATIGGNIVTALAAGGLIGLATALDAELVLWGSEGGERRLPVDGFVLAQRETALRPGEVLRAIEFPAQAMAARTAFRRIALAPLGRAGTVVAGRADPDGRVVLSVTGGTTRPEVLRFGTAPTAARVAGAIEGIGTWFTDAHGAADWRAAMTGRLAEQVRAELAAG